MKYRVITNLVLSKKQYFIPGLIVFSALFTASTWLNLDMSYMGNSSEKFSEIILNNFWHIILFQLIKILSLYLVIGIVTSIIFYGAFLELRKRYNILQKSYSTFICAILALLIHAFLVFSLDLIDKPQLYMENWSLHSNLFREYQFFLTDHIHPYILNIIIYLIFSIALILFFSSINWWKYAKNIYSKIKSSLFIKISSIVVILAIIVYILYCYKLIFYNNKSAHPNILIISADALRRDHLSCNGYFRKTTPDIDALASQSLQVKGVITTVPRTFPSWVSILASQYPLAHEIKHMFPRTRERNKEFNTVCEYLNKLDYKTSVISDFAGDIFPRIDMDFNNVIAPDMNFNTMIKQVVLDKQPFILPFITNRIGRMIFPEMRGVAKFPTPGLLSEETIREIESSRGGPFFIVTFHSITHFPFSAPYPYYKKYTNPEYDGDYKYYKQKVISTDEEKNPVREKLTGRDKEQVIALYDGCLNLFDMEVGKIINYLSDNGLLKNTIIVITSDHGENLYEKDFGMGHGEHLKSNLSLEVPLIIYSERLKSRKGQTLSRLSSAIDIIPTILDIAGLSKPENFDGVSILQKVNNKAAGGVDAYCETGMWFDNNKLADLFFQHMRIDYPDISGVSEIDVSYKHEIVLQQRYQNIITGSKYRTIYSGRYKLIYIPLQEGPRFELYDHIEDPDNNNDISGSKKNILRFIKKKFYHFVNEKSSGNYIVKKGFLLPVFSDPIF